MKKSKYSIVNNQSGEIVGDYEPKKPRRSGHKYILVYGENIAEAGIVLNPLVMALLMQMDTSNRLQISSSAKRAIIKNQGKTLKHINNAIARMISKDLMLRISTGYYLVNPIFVSKSNRNKTMELQSEYSKQTELSAVRVREARRRRKTSLKVVNFNMKDEDYPL